MNSIAIRREDVSKKGEQRAAITPVMAEGLTRQGIQVWVQPAHDPQAGIRKRAFDDADYSNAGATLDEGLQKADIIFGIKEITPEYLLPNKTYLFFSHTHKGQPKNRPMLRALVERRATLIDYELITDESGRRLVTAFTYYAGKAGMIDSLWALGRRLALAGIRNPFAQIPQSIEKEDLEVLRDILRAVGNDIALRGTPPEIPPVVIALLGNGKTSHGAQLMLDLLPCRTITPAELPQVWEHGDRRMVYKLVLNIPDMYRHRPDAPLPGGLPHARPHRSPEEIHDEYLREPARFESALEAVFPYVTMLMNCITWSPRYPRLLTREACRLWYATHRTLRVIGDITCDPEGAIEFSQETWIDDPVFVYQPATGQARMGFEGDGIAVMAVTNLPCEFSRDASEGFCEDLRPYLPALLLADFDAPSVQASRLPPELERATILWRGQFTDSYAYMARFVDAD